MARAAWICTVQLLIPAEAEGEPTIDSLGGACDAVTGMLSENLQEKGCLLDWAYLRIGGQRLGPMEITVNEPYQEGDAFP